MVVKFLNSRPVAEQETALAKMLKLTLREVIDVVIMCLCEGRSEGI